ncbi:MAG: serine/threonine-protein kinase, partial [Isosphaeraceae bacterium]
MESPEPAAGAASTAQPWEPHGASVGETFCASLATGPDTAADSSTLSDIRSCIQLLDRVWPREGALPFPSPPNPVPATLGRFRILGELGRGGFGVVFLAEDPMLGRKLALKVPRVEVLSRGDAWRQFLREAMAASRLDHPNLVPLLETGEIGAVGYIASVYVEGPSLEAWLARQTERMPTRHAARLIVTLARAMDYVHQRGILHRDLKPANVLLQESATGDPASSARDGESSPFVPRICDFGLAKLLDMEAEETRSLVVAGSPSYMAPEQAEGRKQEIGPATDVYGLGAILYELLAGRPPFRGKTSLETLRQVVTEEPISPRQLRAGVTRDLETICLKCLAKKPARRYSTAAALADDLERSLAGRPILARPAPAWERAWKWGRRRPTLASLAVLSILTVFVGLVGLLVLARMNEQLG